MTINSTGLTMVLVTLTPSIQALNGAATSPLADAHGKQHILSPRPRDGREADRAVAVASPFCKSQLWRDSLRRPSHEGNKQIVVPAQTNGFTAP